MSSVRILAGTRDVQDASTCMASAVEEMSSSTTEIENSARRSSQAVAESSTLTKQGIQELAGLKDDIVKTGQVFDVVAVRTKDLQETVSQLRKVVELISQIAGQTNLLALNATIEAARAGEHGRGFAVVANEVKSLAVQTRSATATIEEQIGQINISFSDVLASVASAQTTVSSVVQTAENVASDFANIDVNAASIAAQVADLANILSQQKTAVQELAKNMTVIKQQGEFNMAAVNRLTDQTDLTVKHIEEWRSEVAGEEIEDKVILLAMADHQLWKKRLLDLAVGRSDMKSSELSDHTRCRLGKWYYSPAAREFRSVPAFLEIEGPHKLVHFHGIEAAKCFEKRALDDGMVHYLELEKASNLVIAGLRSLLGARAAKLEPVLA